MPFLTEEELSNISIVAPENVRSPIKNPPEPTTWQVVSAAFRQENDIIAPAAFISRGGFIGLRENLNYDSVTPLKDTKYEAYAERFFDADSDEDVQIIKNRIDREEEDRKILSEGGGVAIASMLAAGVLSPVTFLPVAGYLAKGSQAVKAAQGFAQTSKALGVYAAKSAAVGAVSTAASEAILQSSQEIRPVEESLTNIGIGTLLSGVMGASVAGVSKALKAKVIKDITIDDTPAGNAKFSEQMALEEIAAGMEPRSLSSAAVKSLTLEDTEIAGKAANKAAKAFKKLNPQFNLAQSKSLKAREVAQQLQEGAFVLKMNEEGIETPIAAETRVKLYDAFLGQSVEQQNKLYKEYKNRIKNLEPNPAEAPLNNRNFKTQVSLALTQGDVHPIPEVQKAAEAYRKYLFDPILKEGQSQGIEIFPKDIRARNAPSYFTQVWDQAAILSDRKGFKKKILEYLPGSLEQDLQQYNFYKKETDKLRSKISRLKPDSKVLKTNQKKLESLEKILDDYRIIETRLEEKDFNDIADQIIGHIRGQKEGVILSKRIPLDVGYMREKVFDFIPQVELRPWSVVDVQAVAENYTRQIAPEIELRRIFKDIDLKAEMKAINDEYDELVNKAKSSKQVIQLEKARKNDIKDIEALVGRLRGTYGRPQDADQAIYTYLYATRSLNNVSKLGGQTVSSIPDLGRPIAIKGMLPLLKEGLVPMITNFKGFKLSAREAKLAGAAWDVALRNSQALTMAELTSPAGRQSFIKTGLNGLNDIFSKASLAVYFDAARKNFASVLIQRKNFEDIESLLAGKLDKAGIADLAKNGIGRAQAERINKMWQEFGQKEGELYIANTEKWTDREALLTYRAALNKQISFYSTMTGIGDRPRWMSNELGKTLAQFESFNLAATSKILVAGLQTPDTKTLNSLIGMVSLGMGVYAFRQWSTGKELSNNPADWVAAGVANSGLLGILSSVTDRIGTITDNSALVGRFIGAENEFYNMSNAEKFVRSAGPSVGYVTDFLTFGKLFNANTKWNRKDTRAIRRLIPFQNLFYIRKLLDEAEQGINRSLGVKTK